MRTVLFLALLFLAHTAYGQQVLFFDEGNEETTDTAWPSHTPTTGSSVVKRYDTATGGNATVVWGNDNIKTYTATTNDAGELYSIENIPSTNEYVISYEVVASTTGSDDTMGAVFRYTDNNNYYIMNVYGSTANPDVTFVKIISGSPSVVASAEKNTGSGNVCYKVVVSNIAKEIWRDTSPAPCGDSWESPAIISNSDNSITAIGKAGFCWGNCSGTGVDDTVLAHTIDDVKLEQGAGQVIIFSKLWQRIKEKITGLLPPAEAQEPVTRTAWVISPKVTLADPVWGTVHTCKINTMIDPGAPVVQDIDDQGNPILVPGHYSSSNLIHPAFDWCLSYVRGYDPQPVLDDPQIFVIGENADTLLDAPVSVLTAPQRQRVLTWMDSHGYRTDDITLQWTIGQVLDRIGGARQTGWRAVNNWVR